MTTSKEGAEMTTEKTDADLRIEAVRRAEEYIATGYCDEGLLKLAHQIYDWLKTGNPKVDDSVTLREVVREVVREEFQTALATMRGR